MIINQYFFNIHQPPTFFIIPQTYNIQNFACISLFVLCCFSRNHRGTREHVDHVWKALESLTKNNDLTARTVYRSLLLSVQYFEEAGELAIPTDQWRKQASSRFLDKRKCILDHAKCFPEHLKRMIGGPMMNHGGIIMNSEVRGDLRDSISRNGIS